MLARLDIHPNVRATCSSVSSAFAMVEAGLGIALVNTLEISELSPNLAVLSLSPPQFEDIGIALSPPGERSPAARRFVAYLTEHFFPEL